MTTIWLGILRVTFPSIQAGGGIEGGAEIVEWEKRLACISMVGVLVVCGLEAGPEGDSRYYPGVDAEVGDGKYSVTLERGPTILGWSLPAKWLRLKGEKRVEMDA